jgi:hypothetical protein
MSDQPSHEWLKNLLDANTATLKSHIDMSISSLQESMSLIRAEITTMKLKVDSTDRSTEQTNAKCVALEAELASVRADNKQMRAELNNCQKKLNDMENESRKTNLILDGLLDDENESKNSLLLKIHDTLSLMEVPNVYAIKIDKAYRIGKKPGNKPRPVLIRFCYTPDKETVWSLRKNLKGTNIYLREDFSPQTMQYRNSLVPILKKAKETGHRCTIAGETLFLNGVRYPKGQLNKLPDDLSPANVASRSNEKCYAFFGRNNPLSNFHNSPIVEDGITFNCAEQLYQYKKCAYFDDKNTAELILAPTEPSKQKNLAKNIQQFDEDNWNKVASEAMHGVLIHKYKQNSDLRHFLLATGDKTIVEASPHDKIWGSGLSLSNRYCLDPDKQPGDNLMGQLLMSVREQLSLESDILLPSNVPSSPMD